MTGCRVCHSVSDWNARAAVSAAFSSHALLMN